MSYFEHQADDSKDCSVHSLNNALGFHAVSPEQVVQNIEKRLALFARNMGMVPDDPKLEYYRSKLSSGKTFFSADSVWKAAIELGIIKKPVPVSGFGGNYAQLKPEMLKQNLVLLGVRKDKAYHAVAARDGVLYDSLNPGDPVPLTDENLDKTYKKIFSAYVITRI